MYGCRIECAYDDRVRNLQQGHCQVDVEQAGSAPDEVESCGTPPPLSYLTPRLFCALTYPWSAASQNQRIVSPPFASGLSLRRSLLCGYVHSQILPFVLPSASTSYSYTAAMPFSLANFSEFV